MKRRLLALLLALVLLLAFSACAQDAAPAAENTTPSVRGTPDETPDVSETPDEPETPETPDEAEAPAADAPLAALFAGFVQQPIWDLTASQLEEKLTQAGFAFAGKGETRFGRTTVDDAPLALHWTLREDGTVDSLTFLRTLYSPDRAEELAVRREALVAQPWDSVHVTLLTEDYALEMAHWAQAARDALAGASLSERGTDFGAAGLTELADFFREDTRTMIGNPDYLYSTTHVEGYYALPDAGGAAYTQFALTSGTGEDGLETHVGVLCNFSLYAPDWRLSFGGEGVDPLQVSTARSYSTMPAAAFGTLPDLTDATALEAVLALEPWGLTAEEAAALLDPALFAHVEQTNTYTCMLFGRRAALTLGVDAESGLVEALELCYTCYGTDPARFGEAFDALEPGEWSMLRIAQPGSPETLAHWAFGLRQTLFASGATLDDPLIELHGSSEAALTEMFALTLAQQLAGQQSLVPLSWREGYYVFPDGRLALQDLSGQAAPIAPEDPESELGWRLDCRLYLYAPGYTDAYGLSPLDYDATNDPYADWAE